ncbi:protein piccolo-like [Rhinatrema bivittatum]|uniref:protein piccolo-like n=1 Tax=Rhinatrema bivittatum TaxID=194408 RepID=UPI00112B4664|nr:protein piccolo-like [Rhinatrema bivittatum]
MPGKSPSSMSLRTDFREEQKPSMMPSFLTEGSPLSAVSSVVNKFNPFDSKSESDSAQEEANKKQQTVEKEHGELRRSTNLSSQQQQSPKPISQMEGQAKHPPQQLGAVKPTTAQLQQQQLGKATPQQPGASKQVSQSSVPTREQIKQPVQPPGPTKSHPHQSKPIHPHETSAKPLPHPADATKPLVYQSDPSKPSSQAPVPTKLLPQASGYPATPPLQQTGPVKQLAQPSSSKAPLSSKQVSQQAKSSPKAQGPAEHLPQQPGPSKPQPKQPGPVNQPLQKGPSKPSPQEQGPIKQLSPPPGRTQTSPHHPGPTKQPPQQHAPAKQPSQHPRPAQPLPGFTNVPLRQPSKPPSDQAGPEKPSHQQATPVRPAAQISDPLPEKKMCPLCTTTELLMHSVEKANYNTCTQCQITVCSQCGFNPNPHIQEMKEWLCLNCQMKRALGMDATSVPDPVPQPLQPKQKTVSASPPTSKQVSQPLQKKHIAEKPDHAKSPEPKKPTVLTKQPSIVGSPPLKSKQSVTDPQVQKLSQEMKPTLKSDEKHRNLIEDGLVQSIPQKHAAETTAISQASLTKEESPTLKAPSSVLPKSIDSQKTGFAEPSHVILPDEHKDMTPGLKYQQYVYHQADSKLSSSDSVRDTKGQKPIEPKPVKEDPKKTEVKMDPKPEAKQMPKGPQSSVGLKPSPIQPSAPTPEPPKSKDQPRRFSLNLGSMTETPKYQPTTPQETVTGKLFGFGASIFSQASSFISTATQGSTQSQGSVSKQPPPSPSQPFLSQIPSKESSQAPSSPRTASIKNETKPSVTEKTEFPKTDSIVAVKDTKVEQKEDPAKASKPQVVESKEVSGEPELQNKISRGDNIVTVKDAKLEEKKSLLKDSKHQVEKSKEVSGNSELQKKLSKEDHILTVKDTKLEPKKTLPKDGKPQVMETMESFGHPELQKITLTKTTCPLCKTELNIGCKDPPNFNTCTECRSIVCNLCGFNPTPHLIEVGTQSCIIVCIYEKNKVITQENANQTFAIVGVFLYLIMALIEVNDVFAFFNSIWNKKNI